MRIRDIIITPYVIDKLIWKHHVSEEEVRQVLRNRPKIRFWEKGHLEGENLYLALGQTDAGADRCGETSCRLLYLQTKSKCFDSYSKEYGCKGEDTVCQKVKKLNLYQKILKV